MGDDLTEEEIDDMIADVDTDGSGWVDYDGKSLCSDSSHAGELTHLNTRHSACILWRCLTLRMRRMRGNRNKVNSHCFVNFVQCT